MSSPDRTRQVVVTLAEAFCVVGTLVGVGVIGTRVAETGGGSLSADATLLAPAGPAFSIWSVVYLGLAAYTVWQWLPGPGRSELARRTGWMVAGSMVLNAVWLLVTQQGWIWVSVLVILVLLALLGRLALELELVAAGGPATARGVPGDPSTDAPSGGETSAGTFGTWLVRLTVGLYLGWVAVATFANVAAALSSSGFDVTGGPAVVGALVVLVVVASLAVVLMRAEPTRWGVAAAVVWGLAWLAVGRLSGEPRSVAVGVGAVLAAAAVVVSAVALSVGRSPGVRSR